MNISNFNSLFQHMETKFPITECVNKTNENAIYEGSDYFICMIIDKRFKDEVILKILKPYIWVGSESENYSLREEFKHFVGYAWINSDGKYYVDNFENPVHDEDEVVIGFVRYKNISDDKIWDQI